MLLEMFFPEYKEFSYNRAIPYNLVKLNNTEFCLEFNVAGVDKDEIELEFEKNKLHISAKPKTKNEKDYIINGITKGYFSNTFKLKDDVEVQEANLKNGILSVKLKMVIPEGKKPKKINIKH
jgi:molecular chaperone IbpA